MQCTICHKRLTEQFEHESKVVLQRIAERESLQAADVLKRLHPLCRLCRLVFQQACETPSAEPTTEPGQRLSAVVDQLLRSTKPRTECQASSPPSGRDAASAH